MDEQKMHELLDEFRMSDTLKDAVKEQAMNYELASYRDGANSDDERFVLRRELAGLQEEN